MPIYEFHCKVCQSEFKTLRSASKVEETACPACGTNRVVRLLSVTARAAATNGVDAMPMGGCCQGNASACACRSGAWEQNQ